MISAHPRRAALVLAACACLCLPRSAAAQTGAISGTVTAGDTALPMAGVLVEVTNGSSLNSATTNASGVYTITGLAPGTYYALTFFNSGYINEIYDNIPCVGFCTRAAAVSSGAPIVVTAGVTTANRNFTLARGGRIRGTITAQVGGLPVSGVNVTIRASRTGPNLATGTSGATGIYTIFVGLATGSYYAYTANSDGYLNEIYDNIDCGSIDCSFSPAFATATPIGVTAPAQTAGVDFALARGATVSGTVTDATNGVPLAGVYVYVANAQGQVQVYAITDAMGAYLAQGLPAGTYFAFTGNADGYFDEIYDNIPCAGPCTSIGGGTPIVVTAGGAATGRNFALTRGGRISGSVVAATNAEPLSAAVFVYSSTATLVEITETDLSGSYITRTGLPSGTYYVTVQNHDGSYIDEIYDNVGCVGSCSASDAVALGTPIAVTAGATTPNRNFLLSRGGRITGRVTNAATGAAVADLAVYVAGPGDFVSAGLTDAGGDYEIAGLPPGAYVAWTANADEQGFIGEIYDNVPCAVRCDESAARQAGANVNAAAESTTSGINFALTAGGSLRGTVTNAATGAPLAAVILHVVSATVNTIATAEAAITNASGAFTVTGLPTGTYYVFTENADGYIDEMFGNLPCAGGCPGAAVLGTPVTVTGGAPTTGVDFALDAGGRVGGVVTDAGTSAGVPSAAIDIIDADGRVVQTAYGGSSGAYLTGSGLTAGTYYAVASVEDVYLSEVYGGAPCPGTCSPRTALAAGTPIVVAAAATTGAQNFALERGGQIMGTIVDSATVPIFAERPLEIYDGQGPFATSAFLSHDGTYVTSPAVPSGSYFGFTTTPSHANEIYDNIPCPAGCAPSKAPGGTPIVVTAGTDTTGRNFSLSPRAGVPGPPSQPTFSAHPQGVLIAWVAPVTGGIASSYRLEAGLSPGTTAVSLPVSDVQYLAAGVPGGRYFVRIRALNASGSGAASAEAVLTIGAGGLAPEAPLALRAWMIGSRLMMTWDDPGNGGVPTQYLVEAGSAAGLANIATIPASKRAFTYTPVPAGFYFLRVRAVNASGASAASNEVMVIAGGAASPPRPPRALGAVATGSTVTLTWSAPAGPLTGYVIEAGSAPGLSNLAAAPVGAVTTVSFTGIPAGTYYVRLRGVNALGRSVASEELIIVVG